MKKSLRSARRGWLHRFSLAEILNQLPIGYCLYSPLPPVPHSIHVLLEAILVLIPEQMLEIYLLSIDACVAYKVYMVFRLFNLKGKRCIAFQNDVIRPAGSADYQTGDREIVYLLTKQQRTFLFLPTLNLTSEHKVKSKI